MIMYLWQLLMHFHKDGLVSRPRKVLQGGSNVTLRVRNYTTLCVFILLQYQFKVHTSQSCFCPSKRQDHKPGRA